MGNTEFGRILGIINGGTVISSGENPHREDGTVIWVSSAFNPKTSAELREIADYMDKVGDGN